MTSIRSSQQLGQALRAARKQIGLTQPNLALASGVGVRFIVDLERGKPTVRLENVLRVIDALGGEIQINGLPTTTVEGTPERHEQHGHLKVLLAGITPQNAHTEASVGHSVGKEVL